MKPDSQNIPKTFGRWSVIQKIGEGSFGNIFSAKKNDYEKNQEQKIFAVKTELITNIKQMLLLQFQIYKQFEGMQGFPQALQYVQEQRFSYMVMEKFETSLDKYASIRFPKSFVPAQTLLQITNQTLRIIQKIHQKGYLYRDIKPSNFMLRSPYQQIFIIDFGLCKKYMVNNRHIPIKQSKKLVGTPLFCSTNTHAGVQQSRRDDIESLIFMSLYFILQLPWEFVTNKKQLTKQTQYQMIYKIKKECNWEDKINQENARPNRQKIPQCFLKMLCYAQKLGFQQQPNYGYLYKLIQNQYKNLTDKPLENMSIDWTADNQMQIRQMESRKKQQPEISPKKIKKINFKAPLKSKIMNVQSQIPKKTNSLNQ